jgi:hypothetical protein
MVSVAWMALTQARSIATFYVIIMGESVVTATFFRFSSSSRPLRSRS